MRQLRASSLLVIAFVLVAPTAGQAAVWWQFASVGPNGERNVHSPFSSEPACEKALKATEAALKKKFPNRYPLVGSCERFEGPK